MCAIICWPLWSYLLCPVFMRETWFIFVTWLIHMCAMTHSYVWHDSFICVTWLIHMCDMTHSYVWRDVFICVNDSFICVNDSFICVTWLVHMCEWLIHTCDMTRSYVWHDSFVRVTWHIYVRATWLIDVCVTWLIHIWTPLVHIYDMTHPYTWHDLLTSSNPSSLPSCLSSCHTHTHINVDTQTHTGSCMCDMTHPFMDMTQPNMWYDLLISFDPSSLPPCLYGHTHTNQRRHTDTDLCGLCMCDMTHSYTWYGSFIYVKTTCWHPPIPLPCHVTHPYVWHDTFIYVRYDSFL